MPTPSTTPSSQARRNFWVRTVAGIAGDVAIGIALANCCQWIIVSASLSVFVSFLLWIATLLISLALSQYAVRPVLMALLSDHKLDLGLQAFSTLAKSATELGVGLGIPSWSEMRTRFASHQFA